MYYKMGCVLVLGRWRVLDRYVLDLDSQEKKLISYCFEKSKISPPYFEDGGSWYVENNPEAQIDQMISVLTDSYFDVLDDNAHLAELINSAILKLTQFCDDIIEKEDFCEYFCFDDGECDGFDD